jgi:hypothetical protein
MIPFFRKIRKTLADDNKPIKYLRYAIGEIVLVVIGILIALSINNWNEGRKDRKIEISYLERLLSEVKKDTASINQNIQLADKLSAEYQNYILKMYTKQKTSEDITNLLLSADLGSTAYNLQLTDIAYTELVNTGKLDLISDNLLKSEIVMYYKEYKFVSLSESQLDETVGVTTQQVMQSTPMIKYFFRGFNLFSDADYMYYDEDWQFINKPTSIEFRNWEETIYGRLNKQVSIKPIYENLNSKAVELINSIEKALKN